MTYNTTYPWVELVLGNTTGRKTRVFNAEAIASLEDGTPEYRGGSGADSVYEFTTVVRTTDGHIATVVGSVDAVLSALEVQNEVRVANHPLRFEDGNLLKEINGHTLSYREGGRWLFLNSTQTFNDSWASEAVNTGRFHLVSLVEEGLSDA